MRGKVAKIINKVAREEYQFNGQMIDPRGTIYNRHESERAIKKRIKKKLRAYKKNGGHIE